MERILIGTPIRDTKANCLEEFLFACKKIKYKDKEHLFVDTSDSLDFHNILLSRAINCIHIKTQGCEQSDLLPRIVAARNKIREKFLDGSFDRLFFLDSDVTVPPNCLSKLLEFDFDVVNHLYLARNSFALVKGLGCTLIKLKVLKNFEFEYGYCDPKNPSCFHGDDGWFYERVLRSGFSFIDLNIMKLKHL